MKNSSWPNRLGWLLLVLGLAAGPWPAAIAAVASASHASAAMQAMDEGAPCQCCDDATPCSPLQCAVSTPAPGLPANATPIAITSDVAIHDADRFNPPPDPRPGERLRPPIA